MYQYNFGYKLIFFIYLSQSMYNSRHCHSSGNMFAVHSSSGSNERVQSTRIKRAKWCTEITVVLVRVHRRNGQGLYLRCMSVA